MSRGSKVSLERKPMHGLVTRTSKIAAASGLLLAVASSTAEAQGGRTTIDAYQPAPRAREGFAVATGEVDPHLGLNATLQLDYANDPLVYESRPGSPSSETNQVIHHQLVAHGVFSIGLFDRLQLSAGLPLNLVQRGDASLPSGIAAADGFGLGDVWLGARARLVGEASSTFGLALQANVSFPTAHAASSNEHYSGDQSATFSPTVLAHVNIGILRVSANLGARIRSNQAFLGVERGDDFTYALGAQLRFLDGEVTAHAELFGATTFQDFFNRENTPFEGLLGVKWFHESGFYAGGAVGMGFVRGIGSPDVRTILSLGYTTPPAAPAPQVVEPPPPPADTDGDGLLDPDDACPTEPEDVDSFEDQNGCPDPDNDQDGVLDVNDGAPMDPEDHDDFEDADGVPDPDNDRDGVPDVDDRCPLVPGVADFQGCPPPDRDGDTVVDPVDNCPDEPGTVENHGCREQQQVTIVGDTLAIVDNVYFRTNRDVIERRSYGLLDNVASVILAHPEIPRVRVEGHTDARGSRTRNLALSQARAAAVVRYLVQRGVAADRLESQGFGPDRPVVPNATTPEEHARNRRVEFHIEGVETRSTGPQSDTIDR